MNRVAITVAPLAQTYYDEVESFPTTKQLAQEIYECFRAGASVVHLHVIDEHGNATVDTSRSVTGIDPSQYSIGCCL